jgi:tetratricopeptide (TPR) repeat protein
MTLVPALILGAFELILRLSGYGYPTDFFIQRADISGPDWYIANEDFGKRFFPPGLTRPPLPLKMAARKPAGTQRIFILGESAARGFPDPSSSFPRILEVMLRDHYPERRFEVVNTAMVAINSNTILPIARECAAYEPDLFIVFMGNNEVVGPFGAAGVIGAYTPSLRLIRANLAVKTTRTGQLLHDAGQWLNPKRQAAQGWQGMATFQHSRVRATDPQLTAIYAQFEQNLRDICAACTGSGARVIVCIIPVNLRDCAPFASLHAADLPEADLARWERIYEEGVRFEEDENHAAAIERYEAAARIDREFADLQFRWGRCLLALHKPAEAREKFSAARDLDVLRFRADTKVNAAIRTVAEALGVPLVDAEEIFERNSPDGIAGEEYFLEHVHMSFAGNHQLAASICANIMAHDQPPRERPILAEDECAERLAHTPWNRLMVANQVREVISHPPFTGQLDHFQRNRRWQKNVERLAAQVNLASLKQAEAEYEQVLRDRPDDWMTAMNFGVFLTQKGDLEGAARQYAAVVKREPQIFSARLQLAALEIRLGRLADARANYQAVIKFSPEHSEAHYGLADVLAAEGSIETAREIYEERIKRDPVPAQALEKMAAFHARQRHLDDAKACLDQALALSPDNPSVHANLGMLLMEMDKPDEARPHFEAALRLRPGWPEMVEWLKKTAPK